MTSAGQLIGRSSNQSMHKPVLLKESVDALDLRDGEIFLDGTFGGGGHSREVLRRYPHARIVAIDQDPEVVRANPDFEIRTLNFSQLDKLAIQPDLGISSEQLDKSGRGFSFQKEEPLDMRMSSKGLSAADILNSWDEHAIELVLRGFGEEKYSGRIAREIVRSREMRPFKTTFDLVEAIDAVVPPFYKRGRIHRATRTFQALRIAVNEELSALELGLAKGFEALNPSGRLAVISFHSLEDRIVKYFFSDRAAEGRGKLINKRPIVPSAEEVERNPRSRSAKLRTIEKLTNN